MLPLSDEQRAKFDVQKSREFFKKVEGMPYGYHNFIFGVIDKISVSIADILMKWSY